MKREKILACSFVSLASRTSPTPSVSVLFLLDPFPIFFTLAKKAQKEKTHGTIKMKKSTVFFFFAAPKYTNRKKNKKHKSRHRVQHLLEQSLELLVLLRLVSSSSSSGSPSSSSSRAPLRGGGSLGLLLGRLLLGGDLLLLAHKLLVLLDHVLGLLRDALGVAGRVGVVDVGRGAARCRRRGRGLSLDGAHQRRRRATPAAELGRGVGALGRARLCGVVPDRERRQPHAAAQAAAGGALQQRLAEDDEPADEQGRERERGPEVPAGGGLLGDAGAEGGRRGRGRGSRAEVGVFLVAVVVLEVGGGGGGERW